MRKIVAQQLALVPQPIEHEHAVELRTMSELLDRFSKAAAMVEQDLTDGVNSPTLGREGMTGEQVLRVMIIKQLNQYSYAQLAFHLEDSLSYRRFCRIGIADRPPKRSTLQENIKRVKASTWEAINQQLLGEAKRLGVEDGKAVRVDSTVVQSTIHHPNDSSLLYDVVRTLVRLMKESRPWVRTKWKNHRRVAKRRSFAIANAKRMNLRLPLYRDLINATERTMGYAREVLRELLRGNHNLRDPLARQLQTTLSLGEKVLDQARRRVLQGESVPATEKIVSIFEPHTDLIVKGGRQALYGHKTFLSVGRSGLVLDLVVERGNPPDCSRVVSMLERHRTQYGRVPEQASFDAGFSTKDNLAHVRTLGVKDASFARKSGLDVLSVVRSSWVYRRLQRFRAGIEGIISFLKRCFGLDRCSWRGLESFHAYAHAAVLSANLLTLARHRLN